MMEAVHRYEGTVNQVLGDGIMALFGRLLGLGAGASRRGRRGAHCHLGLGRLYRRTGPGEAAHEHMAIATASYREIGMTY